MQLKWTLTVASFLTGDAPNVVGSRRSRVFFKKVTVGAFIVLFVVVVVVVVVVHYVHTPHKQPYIS